jgi:putative CGCGG family rSAM target protein
MVFITCGLVTVSVPVRPRWTPASETFSAHTLGPRISPGHDDPNPFGVGDTRNPFATIRMEHAEPSESDRDHSVDVEPVTDHIHESSWSANLEQPDHAEDHELVVAQAIDAVEHTARGTHVNVVTHADHGHPSSYLYDKLASAFNGDAIEWEYVDQCGCGGHVTRIHV